MQLSDLKFDQQGLIPAVVQDFETKKVLTVAYMNRESLEITIREGRTCFYSRSRQTLWRKGETSGNVQYVVSITADCDCDALVVQVVKDGPACHLGPEGSYTTYLFEKGKEKILKKVGEECTEVIIGAMKDSKAETIYEISDLCYHVLVLMVARGITLKDIHDVLASRHVIDHKVKQETMA